MSGQKRSGGPGRTPDRMRRLRAAVCVADAAWLALIFGQSLQGGDASAAESETVLEILSGGRPAMLISEGWMVLLRKAAHFAEFFVLGCLAALTLYLFCVGVRYRLPWGLLAGFVIALSDETIQSFVPGRAALVADVWLDAAGFACGLALTLWLCRRRGGPGPKA